MESSTNLRVQIVVSGRGLADGKFTHFLPIYIHYIYFYWVDIIFFYIKAVLHIVPPKKGIAMWCHKRKNKNLHKEDLKLPSLRILLMCFGKVYMENR